MLKDIALALWFFLPAGAGNAAPIPAAKLPLLSRLNAPIDFGLSWRGNRLLGSHKTWRGLVAGILVATLVVWLQQLFTRHSSSLAALTADIHFTQLPTLVLGPLFGLGAIGGDTVKSFCKRRRGIPSGEPWLPFDQVDYILGSIIATIAVVRLSFSVYLWAILLWPLIHIIATTVGYFIGWKDRRI